MGFDAGAVLVAALGLAGVLVAGFISSSPQATRRTAGIRSICFIFNVGWGPWVLGGLGRGVGSVRGRDSTGLWRGGWRRCIFSIDR